MTEDQCVGLPEFDEFFMLAGDLLCVVDPEGHFLRLNPSWESTLGYSLADLEGTVLLDLVHLDDVQTTADAMRQLASGQLVTDLVNRYRCRNGEYKWIEWRAVSPAHGLIYAVGRDISERVLANRSTELLAAIVESSRDAIFTATLDGAITSWNPGAQRIYGYTADEIMGQHVAALASPEHSDEVSRIHGRIARGELVQKYQTQGISKNGTVVEIALTVSPVKDESGRVVGTSTIARDISQQKEAEGLFGQAHDELESRVQERTAELKMANKQLKKVMRALKTMSFSNQTLVRATDEYQFVRDVCDMATGVAGYPLAWVGCFEDSEAKRLVPAACCTADKEGCVQSFL